MSDVQPGTADTAAATAEQADAAANAAANATAAEQQEVQASQEQATGNNDQQQGAQGLDALPEWAQKEIRDLRKESGSYRTKAKEQEQTAQQLAEQKDAERQELVQQIAKTLGLVEDQADDPEALVKAATEREQQAAAERDKMREQLVNYRRKDAVNNVVGKLDGKVDTALLNAVLAQDPEFTALDVDSDDYGSQVEAIVTSKIEAHPSIVQATTPNASGVDTSTTNTGTAKKLSQDDLARLYAEGKYEEINKAVSEGRIA